MRQYLSSILAILPVVGAFLHAVPAGAVDGVTDVGLTVQERAGVGRVDWPITQGVPFARGMLKDVSAMSLKDDAGKPVPMAAKPLAWWDAEKSSIRFALIDFQATMQPNAARRFTLSWTAAAEKPAGGELSVKQTADAITVSTGRLKAAFSKTRPLLWKELTVSGRPTLGDGQANTFYVMKQDGKRFTMEAAVKDYTVEVEEANPLRVVVKQQGWCAAAEGGETYCRYVIRHYFYAGKPWVHLRPTLIFTGLWPNEWIKEFGVELKLAAPTRGITTGVDGKPVAIKIAGGAGILALQSEDNRFVVSALGKEAAAGKHGDGFVSVGEGERALTVAVRDFWQTHPKAFVVTNDKLTVKLWAAESGRDLDFDRMWAIRPMVMMADLPGVLVDEQRGPYKKAFSENALREALVKLEPGTLVNVRMGAAGAKNMALLPTDMFRRIYAEFGEKLYFFACDWFPFTSPDRSAGRRDMNTARGHAKTHDLLMAFGPHDDGAAVAAAWSKPAWALAPASYLCETEAAGPLRGREPGRFKAFDEALLRAADQAITNADRYRINGMLDYGATINWHNTPGAELIMDVMGDQPSFRALPRLGVIDHGSTSPGGGVQRGAWLVAWYTADPSRFDFALRQTGHLMDVDVCHHDLGLPGQRSLGFLGGEGMSHWTNWGTHINTCAGLIDHYLFTGDPYAMEALRDITDYTLDIYEKNFRAGFERRVFEYTVRADYLCGEMMIEYHKLTWDKRAWALAEEVWRNIQKRPEQKLPVLNENYGPHFGWAMYDIWPDDKLRASLIEAADIIVADVKAGRLQTPNYRFSMRALGRTYLVTGDSKYLDAARAWLKGTDQEKALGGINNGLGHVGWSGVATSNIPWIFPALDKEAAK